MFSFTNIAFSLSLTHTLFLVLTCTHATRPLLQLSEKQMTRDKYSVTQ